MSGLPVLQLDDTENVVTLAEVKELLDEEQDLSSKDKKLLSMFFLEGDCRNLLDVIRESDGGLAYIGNYTREELEDMIADAREEFFDDDPRYPSFFADFVREYDAKKDDAGYFPDDALMYRYWEYVKGAKSGIVSAWAELNLNISNILTALIARQQGWNISNYVMGENDVNDSLLVSKSRDFDLGREYDYVASLMQIVDCDNPVEKERKIDALKWIWLDDVTFMDGFSIDAVYAYLCKVKMLERWRLLDPQIGRERFETIIENLRSEAKVPDEFKR